MSFNENTLSNNLQEIYDRIARHLLTQGKPATRVLPHGATVCCFRAADGTSCAIGCLIPNELYTPELEVRWGPYVLADVGLIPYEEAKEEVSSRILLLSELQEVHDEALEWAPKDVVKNWKKSLSRVAKEFGLRPFTSAMLNSEQNSNEQTHQTQQINKRKVFHEHA